MSATELNSLTGGAKRRRRQSGSDVQDADAASAHDYHPANPRVDSDHLSQLEESLLHTDLRCPICLRLMRDPVATECLHRFCKDCIERCQRQAQKQCPSCRKPIATRRLLRPDPNLAALINKLYPDLDAFEEAEDRQMKIDNERRIAEHAAQMRIQWQRQQAMRAKYEADARQGRIARPRVELEVREPRFDVEGERDGDADSATTQTTPPTERSGGRWHAAARRRSSSQPRSGGHSAQRSRADREDGGDDGEEDGGAEDDGSGTDGSEPLAAASASNSAGADAAPAPPQAALRAPPPSGGRLGYYCDASGMPQVLTPRAYELGFRLQRHPLETDLKELVRDFVVVSCLATGGQIQRLLARTFALDAACASSFQLHIALPNHHMSPLPSAASLHEIVQQHHLESASLEVRYRFVGNLPSMTRT